MSLMKLFNYKYFIQNIKKSKSFLAFFLGFIPIIIILIIMTNTSEGVFIPSFDELSFINYIGMYIIPIVISICLFGYVFKKKSVDFVNSMPISRKSIFVTNTLGGIGLILLLSLVNSLLILLLSFVLPNFIIPVAMILDYFLVWSIAYIFVFVCSNIAVSVCGNAITSIAVTMLIIFLIPFMCSYGVMKDKYDETNNLDIKCYDCAYSDVTRIVEYNYTIPYNSIIGVVDGYGSKISNKSLIKTFILSIIYIVIGCFAFVKRKMEVCETSFKSIHVHNTIKCLTMIPFVVAFYEVARYDDTMSISLILLCIIFAYFLIFDLITRKSISRLGLGILYFVVFMCLAYMILGAFNSFFDGNNKNVISLSEIKSVSFNSGKLNNIYSYNYSYEDIVITDKEKIKELFYVDSCSNNIDAFIVLNNGSKYNVNMCVDNLNIDNEIVNNIEKINFMNMYAAGMDYNVMLDRGVIKDIKKIVKNNKLDNSNIKHSESGINLYYYKNRELVIYTFNYRIDKSLENIYVDNINNRSKNIIRNSYIYEIELDDYYKKCDVIKNDCYMEKGYINYKYYDNIKSLIINEDIDINKDYIVLDINTSNGNIKYATNKVDLIMGYLDD